VVVIVVETWREKIIVFKRKIQLNPGVKVQKIVYRFLMI
jgi:hypothetical protein